jgi:hypothetical protein
VGGAVHQRQEERKTLIKNLIDQPFYWALNARSRLSMVRKIEEGLDLSTVLFHMKVLLWIKTGRID